MISTPHPVSEEEAQSSHIVFLHSMICPLDSATERTCKTWALFFFIYFITAVKKNQAIK